jgi:MoxR-like ATPase
MREGAEAEEAAFLVQEVEKLGQKLAGVRAAIGSAIYGQADVVEQSLIGLLSGGHVLLVGVPGLGKTKLVETLGRVMGLDAKRVQFTPDLMPADILGSEVLEDQADGRRGFRFLKGPIFCQLLMADEINRASPRTQSALLQAMQEQRVAIAGEIHPLPQPFHVLATQNPIEQEGTYPLPEAQVDRFMMKVLVGYPSEEEEYVIVQRVTGPSQGVNAVATTEQLMHLQAQCRKGYVDPALMHFAVRLVSATRDPARYGLPDLARHITFGASPRATIGLIEGARALALLRGRAYALPQDVIDLVPDVLRHRLVLSFEAMSDGLTPNQVIQQILQAVPAPDKPLETHVQISAPS